MKISPQTALVCKQKVSDLLKRLGLSVAVFPSSSPKGRSDSRPADLSNLKVCENLQNPVQVARSFPARSTRVFTISSLHYRKGKEKGCPEMHQPYLACAFLRISDHINWRPKLPPQSMCRVAFFYMARSSGSAGSSHICTRMRSYNSVAPAPLPPRSTNKVS